MTAKAQKDFVKRRKDAGLCLRCGAPLDRAGANCKSCNDKINEEYRKSRKMYIACGVCPRCKTNIIMGHEKSCPECRANYRNWADARSEEQKEVQKQQTRASHAKSRQWCKDNGICYNCKKRKVANKKKLCDVCRAKINNYNKEYKRKRRDCITQEQKAEKSICLWCEKPVRAGKKLCDFHCDMLAKNLKNAQKNDEWRKTNSIFFKK